MRWRYRARPLAWLLGKGRMGLLGILMVGVVVFQGTVGFSTDYTITVKPTTLQELKGWGLFPAPYDRQRPMFANGQPAYGDISWLQPSQATPPDQLHETVLDLGFDIARVYISPTIGRSDHRLDADRLQDLKDHLALLHRHGIKHYMISNWSPPAYMKLPDRVRYGQYHGRRQYLDPAFADGQGYDYVDFVVEVLQELRRSGFAAPIALSLQNEPSIAEIYDGCVWTDTPQQIETYRQVVVQLRQALDQQGLEDVVVLAPEENALVGMTQILGRASSRGFAALQQDGALREAIGGFSFHTYATAGTIQNLNAAMAVYGKDRWMTEYSTGSGVRDELQAHTGNVELDWAFNNVRRMAGDLVDLGVNYWFFWRGWHEASQPSEQDLVYNGPTKMKSYFIFHKLWHTVRPGWQVKQVVDRDPDLRSDNATLIREGSGDQWSAPVDVLALEQPQGQATCVLVANWKSAEKRVSLAGLQGQVADIFLTTVDLDMAQQPERRVVDGVLQGGELVLPAHSIAIVVTRSG